MDRVDSMPVYNFLPFLRSFVNALVRTYLNRTVALPVVSTGSLSSVDSACLDPWKVTARTAPSPSKGCLTIREGSCPSGTGGCLGLTSEFFGGRIDPLGLAIDVITFFVMKTSDQE